MVLAMHGGFAFLKLGTVRHKNQVNALVIFFFLLTFAAAKSAIISGRIAEIIRFNAQLLASFILGFAYPFYEGIIWNGNFGF